MTRVEHAVVILAAGKGTRMKSKLPKVLHPVLGKPLVGYCIDTAFESGASKVVVVIGHGAEEVKEAFKDVPNLEFAVQEEQLGTAHALLQAKQALKDWKGLTLVTQGDTPFTHIETLTGLVNRIGNAGMALLTMRLPDPFGYGRIIRDDTGEVLRNVEQKDATPAQLEITEINPGVYCFDNGLWAHLEAVGNNNAAGEYYLPDLISVYREAGKHVATVKSNDTDELLGVNSRVQLADVEQIVLNKLRRKWMDEGVRFIQPQTIYLEPGVELESDVVLWPGVVLKGSTKIGEGAEIGAYSVLVDTVVAPFAKVKSHVVAESAVMETGADAGPFARLRPGAYLSENSHVGNFVELKNTRLGKGAKAGHLAYLGDAEIGAGSNIGAGVITANYDGKNKFKTTIGQNVFVGSNSVLVAPVTLADESFVAGGSAINQDVPAGALGIARERQRNIEGFAAKKKSSESK